MTTETPEQNAQAKPATIKIYEASLSFKHIADAELKGISCEDDAALYMQGAFDADPTVVQIHAILLNRKHVPVGRVLISKGTAHQSAIHPREVFKPAILAGASAVMLVIYHPSGTADPSEGELNIMLEFQAAGEILGIELLDTVIISHTSIFSCAGEGFLDEEAEEEDEWPTTITAA